ncbi:type I restriction enzyme, S subunit [Lishizhenia tianjinensis]|uniref:Type I restriction enzyme, S subunit n=1 Tax=Lishizhenia tianjinensis TaxID=477690 RepID=A0A1I6XE12_9FLAO|nr:restriction endonuclease subunit S [Lishizhenia tianjinensis]SFT36242.1 type I restriction enzyme, S subunit [Lishizhenia tianjinensis]
MKFIELKEVIDKPISGEWGSDGEGVKVIRTTNFTNEGKLELSDVVERNITLKKVEEKKLRKGDVIIEKSGGGPKQPVGRVVFFDEEGEYLCNNFTSVLRPKTELISPKFLLYVLFANHKFGYTNAFQNKTTGIINLQLKRYVSETKIPLPPLEEQKRIAAILDAADLYRQKTKALIAKYDELTQSLFLEMFGDPVTNPKGWEVVLMSEVCNKVTDGTHDTPQRISSGVKFITGKHIRPFKIDYINSDYVEESVHEDIYKRCNPEYGDVLYTNIGANLGTAALNIVNYEFSMKNVALLKPIKGIIDGRYIEYLLNSRNMKEKIVWMASLGGAQQFLSLSQLRRLKINNPPLNLQNQFAERVQAIEQQKAQAQESLAKAEDLFNSLLQRAFKGELSKEIV